MALVAALLALGILAAARRWPRAAGIAAPAALLLCAVAGLTLPDLDQPLPLDHRSMVTHSALPALVALVRRWARPVAAGLALGIGLHLAADVFPNAMIGFATVKLPFAGSIGGELSYVWLAANAVGCSLLGGALLARDLPRPLHLPMFVAVALIGLWYLLSVDGGWPALAVYGAAGWLAMRRRRALP